LVNVIPPAWLGLELGTESGLLVGAAASSVSVSCFMYQVVNTWPLLYYYYYYYYHHHHHHHLLSQVFFLPWYFSP
jgi:hypothetical protein